MAGKRRFKDKEHQLYTVRPGVWKELKRENRILSVFVPGKRPQDNVKVKPDDPAKVQEANLY